MSTYNPSTGLLDVEETPFRLFQADDAIVTNTITYQGVVLDPSLQIQVADLSGVVDGINNDYVSKSDTAVSQTIKSGLLSEKVIYGSQGLASLSVGGGHGFIISTNTGTTTGRVGSTDILTYTDTLYTHKTPFTLEGLMTAEAGIKFDAYVPTSTTQTLYYDAGIFGIGAGLKFAGNNISDLFPRMNTAETNITTNAGNIGTNATAITQMKGTGWTTSNTIKGNSDSIATNASNISTNTGNISTNASDITTIKGTGWTNQTIKGNADNIASNTTSINTNASDITTIKGTGWTNQTIKGNADSIATNTTNISTNTTAIAGKVSKTGDTMTGNLTIDNTSPQIILDNASTSHVAYMEMRNNGYWYLNVRGNDLLSGVSNAINFHASAGAYFDGNLVFSGDNNDVVISKTGTSSKSIRLQAGDDNSATTDDFAIELIVRDSAATSYTAMKVNGKSQQIEINRDLTLDDSRAIIFEGTTTPSSVTNKLHRRSTGLFWENTNLTAAAVNFWDDTTYSGLITPDTTYSGAAVGNTQAFYFGNTAAIQGYIQANTGSTNGYQIFGRANNTDTSLHEKIQIDYQGVNFQFGGTQKLFIGDTEIDSYEPIHLYDGADLYNDGGLQGNIRAESGTANGFFIQGRANNTDNTMEDKMYFNSTNSGFNIGGTTTQLSVGTNFVDAKVELFSDSAFVIRDGTYIGTPELGRIVADGTNNYFEITGLQASGSALETKVRVGRTTSTYFRSTTHQEDIIFGNDDKGVKFKDGASTKLLTYNTTANELQFDGAAIGGWDFDVGSGESINFTNNSVPTTTSKRLYRTTATNVDNLYFDGQIIPQGIIASDQTYWTFPSVGGSTLSYLASFKPTYNSGFLTRLQGNSGMELRFNTGSSNGTGLFQLSAPSASQTRYDFKSINWVAGANVDVGARSLGKYTNYSYNDGTRLVDNNQIIAQANGRDVLLVKNISNTDYNTGDVIIQQRTLSSRPQYTTACGGLRLFNPYTTATWGIFTNDAYDLNFAYNGSNRSFLQDNGNNWSLNFTAFHRSVVEDNIQSKWENYTGLLVETTGEYNNIFYDKNEQNARYTPNIQEALPSVRLTTKLGSKAVFGVLSHKEELSYNNTHRSYNTGGYQGHLYELDTNDPVEMNKRYDIASVGECAVWIIKTAGWENPENGDLFMSSDKQAGYGQIQPDGIVKNITAGKLTCSWDNPNLKARQIGDYTAKLMGCVLYCG